MNCDDRALFVQGQEPSSGIREGVVMRVFVAGGAGVVGRRLVPQLVGRGHQVTATTTSSGKLDEDALVKAQLGCLRWSADSAATNS